MRRHAHYFSSSDALSYVRRGAHGDSAFKDVDPPMPPLTRFTAYKATGVNDWSVFDHLRRHSVSGGLSKERAVFIAHAQEHAWRLRCDRWQQAEHRDTMP